MGTPTALVVEDEEDCIDEGSVPPPELDEIPMIASVEAVTSPDSKKQKRKHKKKKDLCRLEISPDDFLEETDVVERPKRKKACEITTLPDEYEDGLPILLN